jgi:hypothetical protein
MFVEVGWDSHRLLGLNHFPLFDSKPFSVILFYFGSNQIKSSKVFKELRRVGTD